MRVLVVAVAFSLLSFFAGVAGDLSIAAQPMPQSAQFVRLEIPQPPPVILISAAMAEEPVPALAPAAHAVKPHHFKYQRKQIAENCATSAEKALAKG